MAKQVYTVAIEARADTDAYSGVHINDTRASLTLADFGECAQDKIHHAFADRAVTFLDFVVKTGVTPSGEMSADDMNLAFAIRDFMVMVARFVPGQVKYTIVTRFN